MTLFLVFLLALIPRAIYLFLFTDLTINPGWSAHWNLATGILKYGTYGYHGERVTNIEPGYSFFLALARGLFQERLTGVLLLQVVVAALGAVGLFLLAMELFGSRKTAWISASLYAFYPYLIGQSVSLIEVPIFMTCLIGAVYFYVKADKEAKETVLGGVLTGMAFGVTILVRSMVLPAAAVCFCLFAIKRKMLTFVFSLLAFLIVAGPWFSRSHSVDGSWIPPRGGWNFLQGNCPYSDKIIPQYNPDLLDAYVSELLEKERPDLIKVERETDAAESDRFFKEKAFSFIKEHPWRTALLKFKNILYLFYPRIVPFKSMNENTRIHFLGPEEFEVENIPNRGIWRELSYSLTYTPIFLLGLGGLYLRRKEIWQNLVFYAVMINFTAVYALCWPATRLRVPMDFIFMLFAAYTLSVWNKKNCPAD